MTLYSVTDESSIEWVSLACIRSDIKILFSDSRVKSKLRDWMLIPGGEMVETLKINYEAANERSSISQLRKRH